MIASAGSGKVRESLLKEEVVHTVGDIMDTFTVWKFYTSHLLLHLPSGAGALQGVEKKACDHHYCFRNQIHMETKL